MEEKIRMSALPLRVPYLLKLSMAMCLCALPGQALAQAPKPAAPATASAPAAAPGAAAAATPSAAGFKDLQVLPKDITKPALKAIMKQMAKDLGKDCDHCHKEPDMAADTDKKKTAREMMEMVKVINTKFPMTMKKVTCWTCHRGKAEPDKVPGAK
jgi:hypothetical protein